VNLRGAFYYHAWPEVFVPDAKAGAAAASGAWIPVDPTLDQFPADVTHIRLVRGGFEKQAAILPLLGHAKIRILEMEDAPGRNSTPILVGGDRKETPAIGIDLPAPSTKDSCWRKPAPIPMPRR